MMKTKRCNCSYSSPSPTWVVGSYCAISDATPGHNAYSGQAYYKTAWWRSVYWGNYTLCRCVPQENYSITLSLHLLMRVLLKINLNGGWELTDGKKTEREEMQRRRSSVFILMPTCTVWPAWRDSQCDQGCGQIQSSVELQKRMRMDGWMRWRRQAVWKRKGRG